MKRFIFILISSTFLGCSTNMPHIVTTSGICLTCTNNIFTGEPLNYSLDEFEYKNKLIMKKAQETQLTSDNYNSINLISNSEYCEKVPINFNSADTCEFLLNYSNSCFFRLEKDYTSKTRYKETFDLIKSAIEKDPYTIIKAGFYSENISCLGVYRENPNDSNDYAYDDFVVIENKNSTKVTYNIQMATRNQYNKNLERLFLKAK